MRRRRELAAALAVVAAALGAEFASGRESALFYAQLAGASWLGVAFAAAMFGGIVALTAWLARRSGAANLFALLRRAPGGALSWAGCALYALILLLACGSLIGAAGRLGELALPLRHARAFGIAAALLLALWLALGGGGGLPAAGALFLALLALYELALCRTQPSSLPGVTCVLELTLANSIPAALLFAILHAGLCASLGVGVALRAAQAGARPLALGGDCAAAFLLANLLGNAALRGKPDALLALDVPFVALASGWGRAGFWLSALAIYMAAVTSLAGLLAGFMPAKWMLNSKNSALSH